MWHTANSVEAVQQHMLGKGHCRFDIEDDESEYRDFYDFGSAAEAEEDGDEDRHSGIEALVVSVKTSRPFRETGLYPAG